MGLKNLITNFAGLKLKNPVFLASGVAGICGEEYSKIFDLNHLGGFITKTITLKPRNGNPPPRIIETPSGIINNIGLENPGIEEFINKRLPVIRKLFKIPVIVSIGGEILSEFVEIVKKLKNADGISGYELNLSCPNIRNSYSSTLISQDTKLTYKIVSAVKKNTNLPVIAKLSPAVSDITKVASVCKAAGADALSLINSYPAIAFTYNSSLRTYNYFLGGLSGPAIKPIALRMVYEVATYVKIPMMGVGGITSVEDAIEFFQAGATAIAIGSGIFKDPQLPLKIIYQLSKR